MEDSRVGSYVLNSRERVSTTHVREFRVMAEAVASEVAGATACGDAACVDDYIDTFATQAFRRPATDSEKQGLRALYDAGTEDSGHEGGMRFVIEAVLQTPSFMYVSEDVSAARLTDFEIAQRMSAMLWRSTPDAELLRAADAGELTTVAGREEQARRMVNSPLAATALRSLVLQWLGLDRLAAEAFADDTLMRAMESETRHLIDHVATQENASWVELLTAPYTFVDETMAARRTTGSISPTPRRSPTGCIAWRWMIARGC